MTDHLNGDLARAAAVSRRWATVDMLVSLGLLVLAGACVVLSLLGVASGLAGSRVHPDAVLLPLAAAIPLAGAGALFRLAAYAMRRNTSGRWRIQWAAVGLAMLLAAIIWLSLP